MNICKHCGKETQRTYCSLSCSNKNRTVKNEAQYNLNPKQCQHCNGTIAYKSRFQNVYCSHSCAATVNNQIPKRKKNIRMKNNRPDWFTANLPLFHDGLLVWRKALRRCLIQEQGNHCQLCGLNAVWQNKSLTLIVDHIDGNAGNNMPSNLRLLCPNCNSQTPTFCGRNLGNGRGTRGLSKA